MKKDDVHPMVRKGYATVARQSTSCCGTGQGASKNSCCCGSSVNSAETISKSLGYSDEDLNAVPEGANLGLGCGNPIALASLKKGEVVLDLGSGAGFDCFLASPKVGSRGKVIGVDMTPEMLDKARENALNGNYKNVEFRLGEIENLPVADNSVDVVISNCVINLSNDKKRVFQETYRVLKPGGRLMVSDIVLLKELPDFVKESIAAYVSCLAGAMKKTAYIKTIQAAGFNGVNIVEKTSYPLDCLISDPTTKVIMEDLKLSSEQAKGLSNSIASIKVSGIK